MNKWVTLLYTQNFYNIISQLYSNKVKISKSKCRTTFFFCWKQSYNSHLTQSKSQNTSRPTGSGCTSDLISVNLVQPYWPPHFNRNTRTSSCPGAFAWRFPLPGKNLLQSSGVTSLSFKSFPKATFPVRPTVTTLVQQPPSLSSHCASPSSVHLSVVPILSQQNTFLI